MNSTKPPFETTVFKRWFFTNRLWQLMDANWKEFSVKMATFANRETGCKQLCMTGGVAPNSVANSRILRETAFEEI